MQTITVAYGDGFAPEVLEAVLHILREAGAPLRIESIEIGARIYAMDSDTGILPGAWPVLERNKVLLMAPVECNDDNKTPTDHAICERMELPLIPTHMALDEDENVLAEGFSHDDFALFQPVMTAESLEKSGKSDLLPMLHAAFLMLEHMELNEVAQRIRTALDKALAVNANKKRRGRMSRFSEAIISHLEPAPYTPMQPKIITEP